MTRPRTSSASSSSTAHNSQSSLSFSHGSTTSPSVSTPTCSAAHVSTSSTTAAPVPPPSVPPAPFVMPLPNGTALKRKEICVDDDGNEKPQLSYTALIALAILNSTDHRARLASIYQWITSTYPYFKMESAGWQNSVRHNLTVSPSFVKDQRRQDPPGKGSFWTIHPDFLEQFSEGNFDLKTTRTLRRKSGGAPTLTSTNTTSSSSAAAAGSSSSGSGTGSTAGSSSRQNQQRAGQTQTRPLRLVFQHHQRRSLGTGGGGVNPLRVSGEDEQGPMETDEGEEDDLVEYQSMFQYHFGGDTGDSYSDTSSQPFQYSYHPQQQQQGHFQDQVMLTDAPAHGSNDLHGSRSVECIPGVCQIDFDRHRDYFSIFRNGFSADSPTISPSESTYMESLAATTGYGEGTTDSIMSGGNSSYLSTGSFGLGLSASSGSSSALDMEWFLRASQAKPHHFTRSPVTMISTTAMMTPKKLTVDPTPMIAGGDLDHLGEEMDVQASMMGQPADTLMKQQQQLEEESGLGSMDASMPSLSLSYGSQSALMEDLSRSAIFNSLSYPELSDALFPPPLFGDDPMGYYDM